MNSLNYFLRLAVEMSRNNPHYEWNAIPELFRLRISHTVPTPFLCLTLAEIALVGAFAILILPVEVIALHIKLVGETVVVILLVVSQVVQQLRLLANLYYNSCNKDSLNIKGRHIYKLIGFY